MDHIRVSQWICLQTRYLYRHFVCIVLEHQPLVFGAFVTATSFPRSAWQKVERSLEADKLKHNFHLFPRSSILQTCRQASLFSRFKWSPVYRRMRQGKGKPFPVQAPRVPGTFQISRQSTPTAFSPQKISLVLIAIRRWVCLRAILRPEGLSRYNRESNPRSPFTIV